MSLRQLLIDKFVAYSQPCYLGVDFTKIDPYLIYLEAHIEPSFKNRVNRFGQIFRDLEAYKQFVSEHIKKHIDEVKTFKSAVFYNELIQIQVFAELTKGVIVDPLRFPQLDIIIKSRENQRLNKIRNSIAHFNLTLAGEKILFLDDDSYKREEDYLAVSSFCTLVSMIGIFMANDLSKIS